MKWRIFDTKLKGSLALEILTPTGHVILVDDADYPVLARSCWCVKKTSSGRLYAQGCIRGTGHNDSAVPMHRFIMKPPAGMVVHHKNNNGLDNRRSNLEITTHRQNILYAFEGKESGVHFHKQSGKWRAQLRGPDGKFVSLGMHVTRESALEAASKFKLETRA